MTKKGAEGREMSHTTSSSVRAASLLKALQTCDDESALMEALNTFETEPSTLKDSVTLSLLKSLVHQTRTFFQLRGLMVLFMRKMTAVMEGARNAKNEQIVLDDALKTMKDFWSLCSNQQQVIDPRKEFGSYDSSCFEVLPSLASVYMDLAITFHSGKDSEEKALKRLHSLLLFDLNTRAAKAALLEVTSCTVEGGRMLSAILRRLLSKRPAPPEDSNLDYLLHMLLLKRWAPVCPDLEDIVRVSRGVKAPAGFIKWLCLVWPEAKDYVPDDKSLHGSTVSQFFMDISSETVEPLIDVFSRCISSSEEQAQEKTGKQSKRGKHKAVKLTDMDTAEDNEVNISDDLVGTSVKNTMLQPGSNDTESAERKKASQSEKKKGKKSLQQAALGFEVDRTSSVKIKEAVEIMEERNKSAKVSAKRKKPSSDIPGNDDDDAGGERSTQESDTETQQRKRRKIAHDEGNSDADVLDFQIDRSPNKKASVAIGKQEAGVAEKTGKVNQGRSVAASVSDTAVLNGKDSDGEDEEDQGENDDDDDDDEEEEEQEVDDADEDEEEVEMDDDEEEEGRDMVDDAADDDENEDNDEENENSDDENEDNDDENEDSDDENEDNDDENEDSDDENEDSNDDEQVVDQRNFTNVKRKVRNVGGQEAILGHVIDRGGSSAPVKEAKTTQSQTKLPLFSTDPAGHYFVDHGGQHGQGDSSDIQVIETTKIHTLSPRDRQINEEETSETTEKISRSQSSHKKNQALRNKPSRRTSLKASDVGSDGSEENEKVLAMDNTANSAALIEEQVGKKLSEIRQSLEADAGKADSSFTRTPRRKLRSESENSNALKPSSRRRSRSETEESLMTPSRRKSKSESEEMGSTKATRSQKLQPETGGSRSQKDLCKERSVSPSPSRNCTEVSQTPVSRAKGKKEVQLVLSHWLRKPPSCSVAEPGQSKQTNMKEEEEAITPVDPRNSASGKKLHVRSNHVTGKGSSEKQSSSPEKVKSPKTLFSGTESGRIEKPSVKGKMLRSPVRTRTSSTKGTTPRPASHLSTAPEPAGTNRSDANGKDAHLTRSYNLRTPVKARKTSEVTGTVEKKEAVDAEEKAERLDGLKESSRKRRKSMDPKRKSPVSARVTRRMSLRAATSTKPAKL